MFADIMTVYNAFKMPKDRLIADLSLCKEGCCPRTLSSPPLLRGPLLRGPLLRGPHTQGSSPLTVFL